MIDETRVERAKTIVISIVNTDLPVFRVATKNRKYTYNEIDAIPLWGKMQGHTVFKSQIVTLLFVIGFQRFQNGCVFFRF